MRQIWWRTLPREILMFLVVLDYFSAGASQDPSKYLYESAEEEHFVRDFTGDSDSRPDFLYSPSYSNGRVVAYYAE